MPQAAEEMSNLGKPHRASPSPTPWAQSWISTAAQTPSPGNFLSSLTSTEKCRFFHQGLLPPPPWRPKQQPARAQGLCRHNGQLSKTPGEGNQGRLPSSGGEEASAAPPVLLPNKHGSWHCPGSFLEDNTLLLFRQACPPDPLYPCILGGLGLEHPRPLTRTSSPLACTSFRRSEMT